MAARRFRGLQPVGPRKPLRKDRPEPTRYEQFGRRPPGSVHKQVVTLRITKNQDKIIREIMKATKLSRTDIVRFALMDFLHSEFGVPREIWEER